jgi:hypothetical protein
MMPLGAAVTLAFLEWENSALSFKVIVHVQGMHVVT